MKTKTIRFINIARVAAIMLLATIYTCNETTANKQAHFEVAYHGALKNIMHKGDISAKATLSDFKNTQNFYALGAFENLKGEIQIFNSQPFNSYVNNDEISIDKSYSKKAALLVYASVKDWVSVKLPENINSLDELQSFIEQEAKANHLDLNKPFPFLVEGNAKAINWHVINWKTDDTEHTHDKHVSSGLNGVAKNKKVDLLGFYSNAHHAIFTHHSTNMHIHVKLNDETIAGHVDGLDLGKDMVLKLPK